MDELRRLGLGGFTPERARTLVRDRRPTLHLRRFDVRLQDAAAGCVF